MSIPRLPDHSKVAVAYIKDPVSVPADKIKKALEYLIACERCGSSEMSASMRRWIRWAPMTYAYGANPANCDANAAFHAVDNAFRSWSAVGPFQFTRVGVNENPVILVEWLKQHHWRSSNVAHASYPPASPGDQVTVHFNDDGPTWVIGESSGAFDVETVALHELGHLIGLGHSSSPDSVMSRAMYPGTIKRVLAHEDVVAARALYPHQGNWCECKKCHGLFFARNLENSKCPAGDAHEVSGHLWYILACDALPMEGWQNDWRRCNKCQGLFFGGSSASKCPASEHGHESVDGDSNYSINYFYVNAPEVDGMRTNWWWCNKCQGLFFHASGSSVCPSGGLHVKGTTEYSLLVRSQLVDY